MLEVVFTIITNGVAIFKLKFRIIEFFAGFETQYAFVPQEFNEELFI